MWCRCPTGSVDAGHDDEIENEVPPLRLHRSATSHRSGVDEEVRIFDQPVAQDGWPWRW